jgi:predicted GNAT family N-acyltransferase
LASGPDNEPLGTGRLLPDGHIGRMAVLAAWRGKGVGTALLYHLLEAARQRGMSQLALNAQTSAVPFYRRFGFIPEGGEFVEAGIPHVRMVRFDSA